ncbi:MAG: SDR family oxidoreductase [Halocynthiibacter sp.]
MMNNYSDIAGKIVVITGASRGIGEAAAREFANAGAQVFLLARSHGEIDKIAAEIGPLARAFACDVENFDDVQAVIHAIYTEFGRIDVLVNNAGVLEPISRIATSDPAAWAQTVNVNLMGVYFGIRAVLPHMKAQGAGTIINVSSGAAHAALEGWSHYCAAKAAAAMLTQALHLEEVKNGVRVFGLSPGTVATQMQKEIKASGVNPVSTLNWADHIAPVWPARAFLWMCTTDADPHLGQELKLRETWLREAIGYTHD